MADKKSRNGVFEKINSFTTGTNAIVTTAMAIPFFGGIFKTMTEKGEKVIKDKINDVLGTSEAAEKTTTDEGLFEKAVISGTMTITEQKKIMKYLGWLRLNEPKLAIEWVRWVHNILVQFECKRKISIGPKGSKQEAFLTDYTEGIIVAESLFSDLLDAPFDETAEKNPEREYVLLQRNIKVAEKKEPHKIVTDTKKYAKDKVTEAVKLFKQNPQDFNQTMAEFKARSKAWRKK